MRRRSPAWFWLVLLLLAAGVALGSAELMLRWNGFAPSRPFTAPGNEPQLLEPDPVLGWRAKPGRHAFPGYSPDVEPITLTIEPDGRRFSGPGPSAPTRRVAILGDSFSMGWAISDEETYAWKLQERLPDAQFANHATAGYGTYQSLLVMRRLVERDPAPDLIIYGFYDDHVKRNVQDYGALHTLARRDRRTAPYCAIDEAGRLIEHPPKQSLHWPLVESLATVYLLQQRYTAHLFRSRFEQAWPIMEQLMTEMDRLAREHDASLLVAFLMARPEPFRRLTKILDARGIASVDCRRTLRPEWIVRGEGHPNGKLHSEWADCLTGVLGGSGKRCSGLSSPLTRVGRAGVGAVGCSAATH